MADLHAPTLLSVALVIAVVAAVAALLATRLRLAAKRGATRDAAEAVPEQLYFTRFDEAPIAEVERAFERLVADGRIRIESPVQRSAAVGVEGVDGPIPAHVGPIYRRLFARARMVELVEAQVAIELDRCMAAADPIGGWRLAASPEEIDLRLAPRSGVQDNDSGDVVLDATWSPRGSGEIVVHSTILHFLVRSVVGDSLPT